MSRLLRAGALLHFKPGTMADVIRDYTVSGTPEMCDGAFGRGVRFDGSTDILQAKDVRPFNFSSNSYSIVMRIKPSSVTGFRAILGNCNNVYGWVVELSRNANGTVSFFSAGGYYSVSTAGDVVAGVAQTIIVVVTAGVVQFYVNNSIKTKTVTAIHALPAAMPAAYMGAKYDGNYKYAGDIYEVITIPRALSATEIANITTGDPYKWSRTVYNSYNIDGVTKTIAPFSAVQIANIAANLKSNGSTSLGLTTLDLNDFKREYGVG